MQVRKSKDRGGATGLTYDIRQADGDGGSRRNDRVIAGKRERERPGYPGY